MPWKELVLGDFMQESCSMKIRAMLPAFSLPCHDVASPPRQAPGGLRGNLCPGQGEVLVWLQVGS